MNRKLVFFVFLIVLFAFSLLFGGETKSVSKEKDSSSAYLDGKELDVHYFYGQGCPHCANVAPFLNEMEQKYPLRIHKYDVYTNRDYISLFDEYSSKCGLPQGQRGVPAIFVSDTYFVGDGPIIDGFEEVAKKALQEISSPDETEISASSENVQVTSEDNGKACDPEKSNDLNCMSLLVITTAALADSVNPCAIAILVFLIGARALVVDPKKRALKVGLSFCLSVFIAYFLFGMGLLTVVQVTGFSGFFSLIVASFAMILGILSVRDFFRGKSGGVKIEVPESMKPALMRMLKRVISPLGAFIIGFVAVCFELPCTGGPYFFILGQLANSATRLQAVPLLVYYNFIFVLPLIAICLLLYSDFFYLSRFRDWNERNKRLLHLITGFTMIALGFLAIPVLLILQSIQLFLCCFKTVGPLFLAIMSFCLVVSLARRKNLRIRLTRVGEIMLLSLVLTIASVVQTPYSAFVNTVNPPIANTANTYSGSIQTGSKCARAHDIVSDANCPSDHRSIDQSIKNTDSTAADLEEPCVFPHDDMIINTDTRLCSGIYNIQDLGQSGVLILNSSMITLDCDGSTLIGTGTGTGIYQYYNTNTTMKNCNIQNYQIGLYLSFAPGTTINRTNFYNNTLAGISVTGSSDMRIYESSAISNMVGVHFMRSSNITMQASTFCNSTEYDIQLTSSGGTGNENKCDKPDGWNDQGTSGCTFPCTGGPVECTSCSECSAALSVGYSQVVLKNDLTNVVGNCILFTSSYTTFDCQNFLIDGDDEGEFERGIKVFGAGNTIKNCRISDFEAGVGLETSYHNLINNTVFSNGVGISLRDSDSNDLSENNITENAIGVSLVGSSDYNSFVNNTICKQREFDIYAHEFTSGNTRSGDKCDNIYNWNGDMDSTWCDKVCTANQMTVVGSESELTNALNGDFNYVGLDNSLFVPSGILINASHLTLDCNKHDISGNGSSAGIFLGNKIDVTIQECNIKNFSVGIELRSSSKNNILLNTISDNILGVQLHSIQNQVASQKNSLHSNNINNGCYGISLVDAKENDISFNTLRANQLFSIWVEGECDNSVFNNYCGENGTSPIIYQHDISMGGSISGVTYGEVIYCNVHQAVIQDTSIDNGNARNDGILIVNSGPLNVTDSSLNNSNGIYVLNSDNINIRLTTISSSRNDAITLYNSKYCGIRNNKIENSSMSGILVDAGSDFAEIHDNSINENRAPGGDGIRIRYANSIAIRNNIIASNNDTAIQIEESTGNELVGNNIWGNTYGVVFYNSASSSVARENSICYNEGQDIYNEGLSNTGVNNTCSYTWRWKDGGTADGCSRRCVGWYNQRWGFSFHNPVVDDLSYGRYAETYGDDEVYIYVKACIGLPLCLPFVGCYCLGYEAKINTHIPDPHASLVYLIYKDLAEPGTCWGMSSSSLRFYYHDDDPSNYDPYATRVKDLFNYSYYTKWGTSYDLAREREIDHGSQISAEDITYYLYSMLVGSGGNAAANSVLEKAREGLKNRDQNMVLIKNGLTSGHVVNYDTVVDFDNGTSKIYVYDSNKERFVNFLYLDENAYPAIYVDRNANSWTYTMEGGEVWGDDMIFDMPYSLASKTDWSLPLSVNGLLNMVFGDAEENVEDMNGNLLGYDEFNNTYEDIPGGMGVPLFAGDEEPGYGMLLTPSGDYDINIFGSNGQYTKLVTGLDGGYALENISSNDSTKEHLEFRLINGNPYYNELSFQTNDVQKQFNVRVFKSPGGDLDRERDFDRRMYRIFNANITDESKMYVKVSRDYDSVVFANRGPDTLTFDVEFQNEMVQMNAYIPGNIPQNRSLLLTDLQIGPGETITITPVNWGELTHSEVITRIEHCGDLKCGIGEDHVNCPQDCAEVACVAPYDDMHITESTVLCPGTYYLRDEGERGVIHIDDDNAVLDGNGAQLIGEGGGVAIVSDSTENVTVKNCYIQNFSTAIGFNNVNRSKIFQSALVSNVGSGAIEFLSCTGCQITQNYIRDNGYGVQLYGSIDTEISQNRMCPNLYADIYSHTNNINNTGFNNACSNAQGWNDVNAQGCTFSCARSIVVDTTRPSIGLVSQEPKVPYAAEKVTISVNVADEESGVGSVTLSYSTDGGENWNNITMEKTTGNNYKGEIPGLPAGTQVQYKTIAYDNANNPAIEDNAGKYYVYTVIPEFSPVIILPLFMTTTLLAVIAYRRKRLAPPRQRRSTTANH